MTRYLKITQIDGVRYILRVTRESPHFITGIEVDAEGDEIVPRGTDPKGRPWHQRERKVQRGTVKKAVEMRMNPTYATLEVVPKRAHARAKPSELDADIAQRASERAKALSNDAYSVLDHRTAADAHRYAGKLHKGLAAGKDAAWLHSLAESNHRQAAKARTAEAKIDAVKATQTKRGFAAYQEKLAAARDHGIMAEEYARQALAAARKRTE